MILQRQQNNPEEYPTINKDDTYLICYVVTTNEPWCKVIPETLLNYIVSWYHQIL